LSFIAITQQSSTARSHTYSIAILKSRFAARWKIFYSP